MNGDLLFVSTFLSSTCLLNVKQGGVVEMSKYTSLTNGYLILDMISYKFIFRCPPLH